ncbi:MAG: long-chain-fatty-acid--CoA ligase [Pseudomonadales bacterium]|jgi:acyl-CoA synthetase (AMP-forming)/AMP-acid ligase II|tara:strand:- start:1465 stop:3033 length:1569 start_codon:yes stop_codon:yes gene_type:complete
MWPYPEIRNVADIVRYNARQYADKAALRFENNAITMAELDEKTSQFANGLIGVGIQPGDRVAYYGGNSDDFLIALFGTAKASACFVPLNWRLAVEELVDVIADADPTFALVSAELETPWMAIQQGGQTNLPYQIVQPGTVEDNPFRQWLEQHSSQDPQLQCPIDDTALILYTSGTTGTPKGVELVHSGIIHMRICEHLEAAYTWSDIDTFLFVTPNFHLLGIGLTVQAMYNGATIAVVKSFLPSLVLQEITNKKPTILALAPVMIQMLLDSPESEKADFSTIREIVYAGSPISLACIKQALEKIPCRFMQFYGSTEAGGALTLLRPEEHDLNNEERLTSCGKPLPLIDVRIVDTEGQDVPAGEAGELWVRTPGISKGYWRKPDSWLEVYEQGWFKTGDVARQDSEGFLYLVDRVKDMVVTGGENVYCSEVENCLSQHEAVRQVAVIGVPSERWGEEIKAMVILRDVFSVTDEELISYCKSRIAGYKCPKSVDFVDSYPVNANGKVLKRLLREPFWRSQERNV